MTIPFDGQEFRFHQPDGTEIRVRGWGDQDYAVFETLDGYTVVENPLTGAYEYAALSADGSRLAPTGVVVEPGAGAPESLVVEPGVRPSRQTGLAPLPAPRESTARRRRWEERRDEKLRAARAATGMEAIGFAPPTHETVGSYTGLCLLMDFPDISSAIPSAEVDKFCNEIGYSGFGNHGSVYDYYLEVSNQRLQYNNIVAGYVTAAHPRAYYVDESIPQPTRAWELIKEGLQKLKADGFDFSRLTADSQGYVRAINVFYAGERVNNWAKGLWPHSYHLDQPLLLAPGRTAFDYQFTDMGAELTLGTFCHENGHMICDFPDLYDYDYDSNGAGVYCLMCAGANADPKNPVHVGAYLKYQAGWASQVTPLVPGGSFAASSSGNEFFLHARSDTEYFLVENREAGGRDAALPSSGLAIWHIDENGSNNDQQMTPQRHYECSLEQADGRFDLEHRSNNGDAGDLFSSATRSVFGTQGAPDSLWWDGTASELSLDGITAAGPVINFKTAGGGRTVVTAESAPALAIPDADPTGVSDIISLTDVGDVLSIEVSVEIVHTYRGDLSVSLRSPSGASAILFQRQGGSANDLNQTFTAADTPAVNALVASPIAGDWELQVVDHAQADVGTLQRWGLVIQPAAISSVRLEESPGMAIPDSSGPSVVRVLHADRPGLIAGVEVGIDISHTYISDLIVTLTSPVGVAADLHHRAGGSGVNIVKTYTSADTPGLDVLIGAGIEGDWQLTVTDTEPLDVGKLNSWSLTIVPRN